MQGSEFDEGAFFAAISAAGARREQLPLGEGALVAIPCLDDLIRTKRWTTRDRDVADARLLAALKQTREA